MKQTDLFSHASPIFSVNHMKNSLAFYKDQLGFELSFAWEEPATYAVIRRGEGVSIHLSQRDRPIEVPQNSSDGHPALYIFVHDVDAVYQEWKQKGVQIPEAPANQDYGMRDFDLSDPDGNRLTIGKSLDLDRKTKKK